VLGPGSTGLLDMCTASGGGPLGQLSLVFRLASMSSPLTRREHGHEAKARGTQGGIGLVLHTPAL